MGHIRKLVYRLGFRPKRGSIFFSPSLELTKKLEEALKNIRWCE